MKYVAPLLLLFLFSCNSSSETKPKDLIKEEKEAIKPLIQGAFDDLWGGLDSNKILDYHTEDFFILEHGEVWDNTKIKDWMKGMHARDIDYTRINKMDYISIEQYGNSITAAYNNHADFVRNDSILFTGKWLESALAVKTEAGWKLKMMHSTRISK